VHETTKNLCVAGSIPARTTIKIDIKPFYGFLYLVFISFPKSVMTQGQFI